MNIRELDKKIFLILLCFGLSLLGLMGCITTKAVTLEPTRGPENLVYTNQTYRFEFKYPKHWKLEEFDNGVILKKDRYRIGIRFQGISEGADRLSSRTGIPAGELIYSDKIRFLDQVIPSEVLVFEGKSKIVFYGETGRIVVNDLLFSITLDDYETHNYVDVDLSGEIMAEARSIVESFNRIDKSEKSALGITVGNSGLSAHLELTERLRAGSEVSLKFTLMNPTDTPLYILEWYTPLEGIAGEIFQVSLDEQAIPYEGILAYRGDPTPDSYILLNPGESTSAVVDLGTSFDFSKAGVYTIKFISPRISHIAFTVEEMVTNVDDLGPIQIFSNTVNLEIGKK